MTPFRLIGLVLLVLLVAVPLSLAAEWDNVKSFDRNDGEYGTVTINNWLGLGNKIADITLERNTDYCAVDCEAEGTTILYSKGVLFSDLYYKNLLGENDLNPDTTFYIQESTMAKVADNTYKTICEDVFVKSDNVSDDGYRNVCETIEIKGTKNVINNEWVVYNGQELETGTYKWKIKGKKGATETVDWVASSLGVELNEWAWWTGFQYRTPHSANTSVGSFDQTIVVNGSAGSYSLFNQNCWANYSISTSDAIVGYVHSNADGTNFTMTSAEDDVTIPFWCEEFNSNSAKNGSVSEMWNKYNNVFTFHDIGVGTTLRGFNTTSSFTKTGNPSYGVDNFGGGAYQFNPDTYAANVDYYLSNDYKLSMSSGFTWSAWIYRNDTTAGKSDMILSSQISTNADDEGSQFKIQDDDSVFCGARNSAHAFTSANAGSVSANAWHHISCSHPGGSGQIEIYVDGVSVGTSATFTPVDSGIGSTIGILYRNNPVGKPAGVTDTAFDGRIGHLEVLDWQMSDDEIKRQFEYGRSRLGVRAEDGGGGTNITNSNVSLIADKIPVNNFNFSTTSFENVSKTTFNLVTGGDVFLFTSWDQEKISGVSAQNTQVAANLIIDDSTILTSSPVSSVKVVGEKKVTSLPISNISLTAGNHNVTLQFRKVSNPPATIGVKDFSLVIVKDENSITGHLNHTINNQVYTHTGTDWENHAGTYNLWSTNSSTLVAVRIIMSGTAAVVPESYLNMSNGGTISAIMSRALSSASDTGTVSQAVTFVPKSTITNITVVDRNNIAGVTTTLNQTLFVLALTDVNNNTVQGLFNSSDLTGIDNVQSYSSGLNKLTSGSLNATNGTKMFISFTVSLNSSTQQDVTFVMNSTDSPGCSGTKTRNIAANDRANIFSYDVCNATTGQVHTYDLWMENTATVEVIDESISLIDAKGITLTEIDLPPTIPVISPDSYSTYHANATLSCSGSTDPNGDPVTYDFWTWNATAWESRQNTASTTYEFFMGAAGNTTYMWNCRASDGTLNSSFTATNNTIFYDGSFLKDATNIFTNPATAGINTTYYINTTWNALSVQDINATLNWNSETIKGERTEIYNITTYTTGTINTTCGYHFSNNTCTSPSTDGDVYPLVVGLDPVVLAKGRVGSLVEVASGFDCQAQNVAWYHQNDVGTTYPALSSGDTFCMLLNTTSGVPNNTRARMVATTVASNDITSKIVEVYRPINMSRFSVSKFLPMNNTNYQVSLLWNVSTLAFNTTRLQWTYPFTQNVTGFNFTSICTGTTGDEWLVLNFTSIDENNGTSVAMDFDMTISFWRQGQPRSTNLTETLSVDNVNQTYICLNSGGDDTPFLTDAQIRYNGNGFDPRDYYLINRSLDNVTDNIFLYLLQTSIADPILHIVQDSIQDPLIGYFVFIDKFNVGANTYNTVAMLRTDTNGEDVTYLQKFDTFYRFTIQKYTDIVLQTTDKKVATDSLIFTVTPGSYSDLLDTYDDISYTFTYDNTTNNFTATYNNAASNIKQLCLEVNKISLTGSGAVAERCLTSSSGTLVVGIGSDTGTFNANFFLYDDYHVIDTIFLQNTQESAFTNSMGSGGLALTVLYLGSIIFAGLWSPLAGIVLTVIGLITVVALGLFDVSMVFITTFAILGLLIMWRARS